MRSLREIALGLMARMTAEPRFPDAHRVPHIPRTLAGVAMTPDNAITIATVWACIRYLSQIPAVLPWHVRRDGDNGAEIVRTHPNDYLLWKRPNPEWSSFQFRETLTHWALRWGNGYAEIERDMAGRPLALWPIHPERVCVCRDPETRALYYDVTNTNTAESSVGRVQIPMMDMFHIRGFGEGPAGVNVIDYAAQSLGWARAAQLFGAAFFGNGANVSGVVVNKKPFKSPLAMEEQRKEFDRLYGGPTRAHRTAHIDNDAEWKKIGLNAEETQLIAVHQFLIEEICRWFGVPPHKVQHLLRATFTNIESQGIEVVVDSIAPWVKRFEDEADYKLFGQNRQGLYTKIDMRGLMRGDVAARIAYYQGMRAMGCYSANRILELEDENTIGPDGDLHVMQSQNVPLSQIAQGGTPGNEPPPPPAIDEAQARAELTLVDAIDALVPPPREFADV